MSPELTIILAGSLVAASCALVGTFLVLRKMALLGDAISHAVLPGIVIAFLLTGSRAAVPVLLGAGALGLITVLLVELFNRSRRLKEDAAIGVVFPALFSLGVILISRYANQVDLDLDCVLYGEIAYAPLDVLVMGGASLGPKALWVNGAIFLANLLFVLLFYKELKISTFDAELGVTLGFSAALLHYLLMSAVSLTVVGAFESVGAILVVAMLVVPPAAAYLLTERLSHMLVLAATLGVASAAGGYGLARWWDCSIAGAMALVAGLLFVAAFLFSPTHGLLAGLLIHRRLSARLAGELLLLHLQKGGEGLPVSLLEHRFGWEPRRLQRVLARLLREGWVEKAGEGLRLTASGARTLEASGRMQLAHRL